MDWEYVTSRDQKLQPKRILKKAWHGRNETHHNHLITILNEFRAEHVPTVCSIIRWHSGRNHYLTRKTNVIRVNLKENFILNMLSRFTEISGDTRKLTLNFKQEDKDVPTLLNWLPQRIIKSYQDQKGSILTQGLDVLYAAVYVIFSM